MSTRANVIIKDSYDTLYFYRHSDGYPEGTRPTLDRFVELITMGILRDNAQQSAGHLIVMGAMEYSHTYLNEIEKNKANPKSYYKPEGYYNDLSGDGADYKPNTWKVGAYEPTTNVHGDIEWLYIIDLEEKSITQVHISSKQWKSYYNKYDVNRKSK